VLDGNPRSTVALLARGAYDRFGLGYPRTRAGYEEGDVAQWGHFDLRAQVSGGTLEADDFDGFGVVEGALTLAGDFEPGVGISFSVVGQYRDLDGGAVSSLSYNMGPLELMMANEVAYYGGIPLQDVGGYEFDTELDRLVLRNGGKLAGYPTAGAFVEGGLSVTNLLVNDAAVDVYTTPFLGVGIELGILRLRLGWESDLGDDYEAHVGKGEIALAF